MLPYNSTSSDTPTEIRRVLKIIKLSMVANLHHSIRGKIILAVILVLVALVVSMSYFISASFLEYGNTLVDEKIAANVNTLNLQLEDGTHNAIRAALTMANKPETSRALKRRDTQELLRISSGMIDPSRVNYFTFCDDKGIVLARSHEPGNFGDSIIYQKNVVEALNGNVSSLFEPGSFVKISARASAPVYDANGKVIGAVLAGKRFDTEEAVNALKELLQSEVTIFFEDTRIATTLKAGGQIAVGTKLDPAIAKVVLEGGRAFDGIIELFGEDYRAYYAPLKDPQGRAFGAIFIGRSQSELKAAINSVIRKGIIVGMAGLLLSIFLLSAVISAALRPITNLSKTMDSIASGDLNVDVKIKSQDEAGRLASSLQKVVEIIHKLLNDINRMIVEHEKGNTDYRLNADAFRGEYKKLADNISDLADVGIKDHLTGLSNRRSFDSRLELEWTRAIRDQKSIGLLMMDLDEFKAYNDTFGHQQGDIALQESAKVFLRSMKRRIDFAARWGGEEFVVLLPISDLSGATTVAENIRAGIENMEIPCNQQGAEKITISIGVCTQKPAPGSTFEALISTADSALYKAKQAGRNKVVSICIDG